MGHSKPIVLTSDTPEGLTTLLQSYTDSGYRLRGMMHVVLKGTYLKQQGTIYEYEYGMLVYKESY